MLPVLKLILLSVGGGIPAGILLASRATALAAGHGFLTGWAFAIAGDMN